FLGLDVRPMGHLPFSPVAADQIVARAVELGLALEPDCTVICLPLICGYVGADTVGVILALDMLERKTTTLAIDIGTNGEIALLHRGQLYTCSTAAGPAFEGAQIRSGMQARRGAIVKVAIREEAEEVELFTVEDAPAEGLAGTGLIDAVAELLRVRVLHPSGRFQDASHWPPFLTDREVRIDGQLGFRLSDARSEGSVYLLQGDVRQLQTAKAAIATGVTMLLKEAGVGAQEVEDVLVAGAFGSYLDSESVLAIGLLPSSFRKEIVKPVGNAALGGAILAALSASSLAVAQEIKEKVRHVELSMDPSFQDEFVSQMLFPGNR
ncbi:MAG: ASKHA domain-containing protein, partial [Chloroflexi bacterium]|nr:ASKHA domain-containing protein [Chloroflexota bacterium]